MAPFKGIQQRYSIHFNVSDCSCNAEGSTSLSCDEYGKCFCKENFMSNKCKICAPGYYGLPNCTGKLNVDDQVEQYALNVHTL